jgi:hypothetical protein
MPTSVAQILQLLDTNSLLKLSAARKLPGRRPESELRPALNTVYSNSAAQLLFDLQRDDLQQLLQRPFRWQGHRYFAPDLTLYSKEQLLKFANTIFVQRAVPAEFGKEYGGAEFSLEIPRPVASPKSSRPQKITPEEVSSATRPVDDDDTGKTIIAPGMRFLITLKHDWSRPRALKNVFADLGFEVPERLRTSRFQELMRKISALGVEVSDADSGVLLTPKDSSPGVDAKVRLRRARA